MHLLALINHQKVVSFQFVCGNLSSAIIFAFLETVLTELNCEAKRLRREICIVLDNSPMNQFIALRKLVLDLRIELLFTAPNSSFQNPIEFLFAKIKAPLKTVFSCNK